MAKSADRATYLISHRRCQWPVVGSARKTFLHDLKPIWEDLIDRIRHVDERFVKEGCGMPDSLKPVKSYEWTDAEWLRLMREIDPKEEISVIERRVAEWRDEADKNTV